MTTRNPYAWLIRVAEEHCRRELNTTQKPRLTLITTDSPSLKTRKPKMKTTPAREAMKAELADVLKGAMPPAADPHSSPLYRKLSGLKLVDHAAMVHNALEAVRCLVIPSSGNGITPGGYQEDLSAIGRNHFVDLLEIINDRLGAAIEMDDAE